jgi:hypothetical protein
VFQFSSDVEIILRQSGWFPDRSVAATQWIDPLLRLGCRSLPEAHTILESLGGLEIHPPPRESNLFFPGAIAFDPVYAASSEIDRIKAWEQRYRIKLFPLGEYEPSYLLLLSDSSHIFGAREKRFYRLGKTIEDALELLTLANRQPEPVAQKERI